MPTTRTFIDTVSVTAGDRGRSFIFVGSTLGLWRLPSLASLPRGWAVGLRNSGPADVEAQPVHGDTIEGLSSSAAYTHVPFSGAVYVADVSIWRQSMLFAPGGVPIGGTSGQVLRKESTVNYDDTWQDAPMPISVFLPGIQSAGAIARVMMTEAGTFPADFVGSFANAKTASAGSAIFAVNVNVTNIGSVTFNASNTAALATTGGVAQSFVAGDIIEFVAPSPQDLSIADIAFGLRAIRA